MAAVNSVTSGAPSDRNARPTITRISATLARLDERQRVLDLLVLRQPRRCGARHADDRARATAEVAPRVALGHRAALVEVRGVVEEQVRDRGGAPARPGPAGSPSASPIGSTARRCGRSGARRSRTASAARTWRSWVPGGSPSASCATTAVSVNSGKPKRCGRRAAARPPPRRPARRGRRAARCRRTPERRQRDAWRRPPPRSTPPGSRRAGLRPGRRTRVPPPSGCPAPVRQNRARVRARRPETRKPPRGAAVPPYIGTRRANLEPGDRSWRVAARDAPEPNGQARWTMSEHKIGTREEWQAARDELAKLEAEHAELARRSPSSGAGCPGSRWRRTTSSTPRTARRRSPSCSTGARSCSPTTSCSGPTTRSAPARAARTWAMSSTPRGSI